MTAFEPEELRRIQQGPRWSRAIRADLDPAEIATWDPGLDRDERLLVPIDVQALYVPVIDAERYVSLPFALSRPDDQVPGMPAPFAPGQARPPGVHLHWALPDAVLRGRLEEGADGGGTADGRLELPALPDRWVVLRILAPVGADDAALRGWVVEADRAVVTPLDQWPSNGSSPPVGRRVEPDELTATAGGSALWSTVYDATAGRFSLHDPLDDIATAAPNGAFGDQALYVVAGWYSNQDLDPLDASHSHRSLFELLADLGWTAPEDYDGRVDQETRLRRSDDERRRGVDLGSRTRYQPAVLDAVETGYRPDFSPFADRVDTVTHVRPYWPRSSLFHGEVHGVPVGGAVIVDQRPPADQLRVAIGGTDIDLAAALAAAELAEDDPDDQRALERVLAGFAAQRLGEIGSPDGMVAIEEHEHRLGFGSLPGPPGPTERVRSAGGTGPLPGRAARSAADAPRRPGRSGVRFGPLAPTRPDLLRTEPGLVLSEANAAVGLAEASALRLAREGTRAVRRPGPNYHLPLEPLVAVSGPTRSLRHRHDGHTSADGRLVCRWPSQVSGENGEVDGVELIRTLGNGAVPGEILTVACAALVNDPYLTDWLADATASRLRLVGDNLTDLRNRLEAEAVLRYGTVGAYDGGLLEAATGTGARRSTSLTLAEDLRRFSQIEGVDIDPKGTTSWIQPWIPLFCEWEVEITLDDRFDGWSLGPIDLEAPAGAPSATPQRLAGRSPLNAGPATTLAAGIDAWLEQETLRDAVGRGEIDDETADLLGDLGDAIERLDIVATTLDTVHDHLLGLPVGPYGVVSPLDGTGGTVDRPAPVADPQLVAAGTIRLVRARLVDAFGRTLNVPTGAVAVPRRIRPDNGPPATVTTRPRFLRPARWMFRLVDPADLSVSSQEASIDQIDPTAVVNPVAGYLLPDHIDEALEVFDTAGRPLGQLMHEPFGGGVTWEIAPGRSGPADAGPNHELAPAQQLLGSMAASLVAADAQARDGRSADPDADSALTALLRAIDTTLWSVDTFASFGTEHVAGLVGRPVAVVRALLWLELDDDLDELDLTDAERRTARERAYRELADRPVTVRIGELTRTDDGTLGFFVDDDYRRFRVVDKVVRDAAVDSRRLRGHFQRIGRTPLIPDTRPIDHPYLEAEDELRVHLGQVVRLTILMHPRGKVHLTSGVLPRKSLQLARDWTEPGLAAMSPSVRVGPVLIEPGEVRLPKVSAFPDDQVWTRRVTPTAWRDDPIVAATQSAVLPILPARLEEGYIRVAPTAGGGEGADR